VADLLLWRSRTTDLLLPPLFGKSGALLGCEGLPSPGSCLVARPHSPSLLGSAIAGVHLRKMALSPYSPLRWQTRIMMRFNRAYPLIFIKIGEPGQRWLRRHRGLPTSRSPIRVSFRPQGLPFADRPHLDLLLLHLTSISRDVALNLLLLF
jgi:hypothetical protein